MGTSADIKALRSQMAALTARVARLESTAPPVVIPPVVTPPPVVIPPSSAFQYPLDVVGPSWKVTLESGKDVTLPPLATYSDSNFRLSPAGNSALLRAHYGGGTTPNSLNPRCEWRELTPDGSALASWSATSGRHKMAANFRVNRLTEIRPHLVVGQIHDASNDITVWRVEGNALYLTSGNETHTYLVTNDFRLGSRHTIEFDVSGGVISYRYDGELLPFTLKSSAKGLYYRHGAYVQANPKTAPGGLSSDYAEVETFSLVASHS